MSKVSLISLGRFFLLALFVLLGSNGWAQTSISTTMQLSNANTTGVAVTLGGYAPYTGTFTALPYERVDQLITRVFEKSGNYAPRDIVLKRKTGEVIKIDLTLFRITGDYSLNPILKNEDVILFPWVSLDYNFYSINGAVKSPNRYQFVEGDHLTEAIQIAGGINPAFENVHEAQISRLSYDGLKEDLIICEISSNPELKRGDRIRIIADESYRKNYGTYIFGEVKRPGFIPVTKENNSLASIIEKAGGLLESANNEKAILYNSSDLSGIYIDRQYELGLDQTQQLQKLQSGVLDQINKIENSLFLRMSNLAEEDTAYFSIETRLRTLFSQSRISIVNYRDTASEASHYYVRNGDYVYIPPKEKFIHVFGQVSKPGDVSWVKGASYQYYIDKCGGYSELAKKEAMIITGETREWISVSEKNGLSVLNPGDYLFIPKIPIHTFPYYVDLAAKYSSIVGAIATTALLIIQVTKK